MPVSPIDDAIQLVPAGPWAVGVSGGADSVALLDLLRRRTDLALHVVHLDHQTRGSASAGDATFVENLSRRWALPYTLARRAELEPALPDPPANPSARYRALRLALFQNVVKAHHLQGVILAHHADDQAETVFQRLLRGSGYAGLAAMSPRTSVGLLTILRPLLAIHRAALRQHLRQEGLDWREDASNQSDDYQRNRVRRVLEHDPRQTESLLELAGACARLREWVQSSAPVLAEQFRAAELLGQPGILASESARRWLLERGVPADQIEPATVARLIGMARDAASPARQQFPGALHVRRRGGLIFVDPQTTA